VITVSTAAEHPDSYVAPTTPREIRAALLPEEVGDFDREYRHVMAEATETLDLTVVHDCLARWRLVAISSRDHEAHRHMLDTVRRLSAGEDIPTVSWEETKARLGL